MTNKEFLANLSTSTLKALHDALRSDRLDLRALKSLGQDSAQTLGAIGTIDELLADIASVVIGDRGENL